MYLNPRRPRGSGASTPTPIRFFVIVLDQFAALPSSALLALKKNILVQMTLTLNQATCSVVVVFEPSSKIVPMIRWALPSKL